MNGNGGGKDVLAREGGSVGMLPQKKKKKFRVFLVHSGTVW